MNHSPDRRDLDVEEGTSAGDTPRPVQAVEQETPNQRSRSQENHQEEQPQKKGRRHHRPTPKPRTTNKLLYSHPESHWMGPPQAHRRRRSHHRRNREELGGLIPTRIRRPRLAGFDRKRKTPPRKNYTPPAGEEPWSAAAPAAMKAT
jgi:hypothetical protein